MNIYMMYLANGSSVGFWVRRNSWGPSTFARVIRVGGKTDGPLNGSPPYFNNQTVLCDFYMAGKLHTSGMTLSCPGTYAYELIPEPN